MLKVGQKLKTRSYDTKATVKEVKESAVTIFDEMFGYYTMTEQGILTYWKPVENDDNLTPPAEREA